MRLWPWKKTRAKAAEPEAEREVERAIKSAAESDDAEQSRGDNEEAAATTIDWASDGDDPLEDEEEPDDGEILLAATGAGDLEAVDALLVRGTRVDTRDDGGRTPLHIAIAQGHTSIVKRLLDSGASLEAVDEDGNTVLHYASYFGQEDCVECLLQQELAVDVGDNQNQTPLHMAIHRGHLPVVKRLFAANASLQATDDDGYTALHWASHYGHAEIVAFLLQQNVAVDAADANGSTPLRQAFSHGHYDVAKLLVQANASIGDDDGGHDLLRASSKGEFDIVKLLLDANISVDVKGEDDVTPLHWAASYGHVDVVRLLLEANASVDARAADGCTPLHRAAENGKDKVVELLLKASASVDAISNSGDTPLHRASEKGRLQVVKLLLGANASVDATDLGGETPLFKACYFQHLDIMRLLLASHATLHTKDSEGLEVLHRLLEFREFGGFNAQSLETLKVLVEFGAEWDDKCTELVEDAKAWDEASAVALCMQLWKQEHKDGFPFSDIPIEVVRGGEESTQTFVDGIKTSKEIVYRRKICLVGHSCAGKTTFVKSITAEAPQLENLKTRTIGIDQFRLRFEQEIVSRNDKKIHEVTFWDFAGQNAYQVAHSLFFSPRTLFLVFVDLQAFTIAYKRAKISAKSEAEAARLLDEFIERTVLHWIHLIVARQREAEFVFVATKEDCVRENTFMKSVLKNELETRLRDVAAVARDMRVAAELQNEPKPGVGAHGLLSKKQRARNASLTGRLFYEHWRGRGANKKGDGYDPTILYVSCYLPESVASAKAKVEEIIMKSDLSVLMPDIYSSLLKTVVKIRDDAAKTEIAARIRRVFPPVDDLLQELKFDDKKQCLIILRTLHDLGDVLWYEALDVALFHKTIILDPFLLIDFIRQVINHNHTDLKMSHSKLMAQPFWSDLDDPSSHDLLQAMKKLMQCFHLVYSEAEDRSMAWDSHLIVPAAWQTNKPVAHRFPAGTLRFEGTAAKARRERARVRWEYDFAFGLSPNLFDHLVVASVSPWLKFEAGPDWLWHQGPHGRTACRVMIDRDRRSLHRTIHVEAVIATDATPEEESALWEVFKGFVRALVTVVGQNRGLAVSCQAFDEANHEHDLKPLLNRTPPQLPPTWMPPPAMWKELQLQTSATN